LPRPTMSRLTPFPHRNSVHYGRDPDGLSPLPLIDLRPGVPQEGRGPCKVGAKVSGRYRQPAKSMALIPYTLPPFLFLSTCLAHDSSY
jgi:hypothetical protein